MQLGLEGRVALVTGASEGIGAGIAEALAMEGVDVAICARGRGKLEATAARIAAASGRRVVPLVADLATPDGCHRFVHTAHARLGRIDILVNNAGSAPMMPFVDMPDEVFVEAFDGKLFAAVRCSRVAIGPMRAAGRGVILNITGATQQGVPMHAAGGSANAALRMFSKVLSLELAPWGIRVNSIGPGRIRTERLRRTFAAEAAAGGTSSDALEAAMIAAIPTGRLGEVDDIAKLVCFLSSDSASYINGAAIPVDGGKAPLI
jgi:3-oxoacyl-[acyl-carrier protein] reductase